MPKVTVILTSYNHAKYIRETIDSILNQTFKDFELIIWDDASTDDSWEIIQSYKDKRIKTFRNEESKRAIYGINKTIKEISKGKYIAIHHSDDIWQLTKLEKQVKFLDENREYGAVFTNAQAINENSGIFEDKNHMYYSVFDQPNRSRQEWLNFFFYKGNALCHPSVMIKKECYDNCGVYRYGLAQIGDFDMWIRICMKYEIYVLPEKLTKFRVRDNEANASGNTSTSRIRTTTEYLYIIKNFAELQWNDFIRVFPNEQKYRSCNNKYSQEYVFARLCIEEESLRFAKTIGFINLYEIINNTEKANLLKNSYNFDYLELINLSAKYDIFNIEQEYNKNLISKLRQKENNKLIFFGASSALEKRFNLLKEMGIIPDYICDNDKNKHGKYFEDYKIKSPSEIFQKNENFFVLITSSYVNEIKQQIIKFKNIIIISDLWELGIN